MRLIVDPHPLLEIHAFVSVFPYSLGEPWPELALPALLSRPGFALPDVDTKTAVRDLLRHGGFKPAGRNKPASEYVRKAVPTGQLGAINAAVDACNAASYLGGLPISVIDLDRAEEPFRVGTAASGSSYVFNQSGQVLDLGGLLVLFDGAGPCANSVKDSQRTKTHEGTTRTLSILWGTTALPGRAAALGSWYAGQLSRAGVTVSACTPVE